MIGDNIRYLRKAHGMSQDELAAKLGYKSFTTVQKWESNLSEPPLRTVHALAALFNVDIDDLSRKDLSIAEQIRRDDEEIMRLLDFDNKEIEHIKKYRALDEHGKRMVDYAIAEETARMIAARKILEQPQAKKKIVLLGDRFAAGPGDPDLNVAWEDYEVDADSKAEFAVHISGDSLEPHLHDGDIALALKRVPEDGEVGAFLIDGEFLVKQVVEDSFGNLYLFAVNRKRKNTDRTLWARDEHQVICFGTLLLPRIPLPKV